MQDAGRRMQDAGWWQQYLEYEKGVGLNSTILYLILKYRFHNLLPCLSGTTIYWIFEKTLIPYYPGLLDTEV